MALRVRTDGERSRERVLEAAARLATVEGLDGLSLARLADVTGMSKSGVFGLFGSKEELQLATVRRAREVFMEEVVAPALSATAGRAQLLALCEAYLGYVSRRVWPGGCFFASVASEVSARPGPVRDRVAADQRDWVDLLRANARVAAREGDLGGIADPDRLALELSTMLTGADIAFLLQGDSQILDGVRHAIRARLAPSRASRRRRGARRAR